jgi:hypothetical protein
MDFCHENGDAAATASPNSETCYGSESNNSHADSSPKTTAPQPFPAIEQLRALGYRDGDRVYLRAIGPNGAQKFEATFPDLPIEQLQALNSQGDGIYFVVNGGGHCDADVAECRSIFYEHDDLEIELQLGLWRSLGLPVPTIQISTGGKSIHSYWNFREPLETALWRRLQADLLEMADADRSIKNPSRVMRLAGFAHQTTGAIATIETNSGILYDAAELRELIPMAVGAAPISAQLTIPPAPIAQPIAPKPGNTPQNRSDLKAWSGAVSCEIPLETALSKTERANLAGVSEGGRDNSMAALARGAIGLERYLQSIGQRYSGSAQNLLESACGACNPPLGRGDIDRIWRSAEKSTNGPTLSPEAIANCIKKYWRETELESEWAAANKKPPKPRPFEDADHTAGFHPALATGLNYTTFTLVGDEIVPEEIHVGDYIELVSHTNNTEGDSAGLYLQFKNQRGNVVTWTMPRRLIGDLNAAVCELAARGYKFVYEQKKLLFKYLAEMGDGLNTSYTITQETGWINGSFVLPHGTIGDQSIRFHSVDGPPNPLTHSRGTPEEWRSAIGSLVAGNSRLELGVSIALAAPLLSIVGLESGFFHIVGATSKGKTIALTVAASVTGEIEIPRWLSTGNALETTATAHNHLAIPLDEISQADPRTVAASAYMLGNGRGKGRMAKDGSARPIRSWTILGFSSGEKTLTDVIEEGGTRLKGGMEVRFPSIPAEPKGSQHGLFETIHGFSSGDEFAHHLSAMSAEQSGTILGCYLEKLIQAQSDPSFSVAMKERLTELTRILTDGISGDDGAIRRVARRFALCWLALEKAQEWGVTAFPKNDPEWAIKTCFVDWIEARGGLGSIEIKLACDRFEELFVASEFGDRIRHISGERSGQIVRDLLATRIGDDFLVPPTVFKRLAQGVDQKILTTEMQKRGWLEVPTSGEKRATVQRRIPGEGNGRFYVFRRFWGAGENETIPVTPDNVLVTNPGYTSGYKISAPENLDVPTVSAPEIPVTRPIVCNQGLVTPETPAPHSVQPPCNRVTTISRYEQGIENENKKIFSDSDHVDLAPDDFDWSVAGAVA